MLFISESRIEARVEELSASIDVQQVYTKVVAKVAGVDVRHACRASQEAAWQTGDFYGLLFTSSDLLSTNTCTTSGRTTSRRRHTTSLSASHPVASDLLPEMTSSSEAAPSHAFVTLTFTRALKRSVWRKFKLGESSAVIGRDSAAAAVVAGANSSPESPFADVYLNEFSVKVQPFDCLLNCPALTPLLQILSSTAALLTPQDQQTPRMTHTMTSPSPPLLSSNALPLLYLEMSRMRLFMPQKKTDQPEVDMTSCKADLFLMDVAGISLQPQAENPLPR